MKICLTGSTGFVGSKLCNHLLNLSYEIFAPVRTLDLSLFPKKKNLNLIHIKDDKSFKDYSKCLIHADIVIHCAAKAHVMKENQINSVLSYRSINVDDTINLAKQAISNGVKRFIFLSSIKVNGEQTFSYESFKHDDFPKPEDPYGISKLEAENALLDLSNQNKIEVVIIRAPLIYGEGVKGNFLRLLNLCNRGLPLPFGNINNKRSLVGIDNLIDLITCCMNHPKAPGNIFLISDNEDISTTKLIQMIKINMGKPDRLFFLPFFLFKILSSMIGRSSEVDRLFGSLTINISHTQKILGWKPITSLDKGLKKTINWYLNYRNL